MKQWTVALGLAALLSLTACTVDETGDVDVRPEVQRQVTVETREEARDAAVATNRGEAEAEDELADARVAAERAGDWTAEKAAQLEAETRDELADARRALAELEREARPELAEAREDLRERIDILEDELAEFGHATGAAMVSLGESIEDGLVELRQDLRELDVDFDVSTEGDANAN